MCYKTTCKDCQKPTWAGCGNHIERALADIPQESRCHCNDPPQIPVRVAFSGGLEILFDNKRSMVLQRPIDSDITSLIIALSEMVQPQSRREVFMQDDDKGNVRPGILVLINDSDWQIEGEGAYKIQKNDEILFMSTLHGG